MNDDAEWHALPNGDCRLDVEVLFGDPLSGAIDSLLHRPLDCAHEVAIVVAQAEFSSDAEKGGKNDAFQEAPGMEIHLVLQARIP